MIKYLNESEIASEDIYDDFKLIGKNPLTSMVYSDIFQRCKGLREPDVSGNCAVPHGSGWSMAMAGAVYVSDSQTE